MEEEKKSKWAGIPMTEEELKEFEQYMKDIQESIEIVYKNGKNI